MLKDKLTCLILSCDKFSDLWEGNVKLFNLNWADRDFKTFLVTDKPTDRVLPGVEIIAAGEELEWSDRLAVALKQISSDFVFITLDDYFLIKPVEVAHIMEMISLMESEGYDYLRFFPRPKRATGKELDGHKGVFNVNTNMNYSVNLYSGLWRKTFLNYSVREPKSAWAFEVSLSKLARDFNARCLCSYNNEYEILDVVRKGKILHKANSYFKRHPGIYHGDRPLQSWGYEFGLWIKTFIGRHTHSSVHKAFKAVYKLFGGVSYTDSNK